MTGFLGDYTAEFMQRGRGPDKRPRKRRIGRDALTAASAGITGAGLGVTVPGVLPVRSKAVDKALTSRRMNRIPLVGKQLRGMAIEQRRGYSKAARKYGQYLSANSAAITAAGLAGGVIGLGVGLNQVRRSRKKARMARKG